MFPSSEQDFQVRLSNAEGVPVLHVIGDISKSALKAVETTLDTLARAGHYNIVINVEQCRVSNWETLSGLAGAVRYIRDHYGAVELVAAKDRIQQILRNEHVAQLFRLCASERQAIARIKKLHRQPDRVPDVNARLVEQI